MEEQDKPVAPMPEPTPPKPTPAVVHKTNNAPLVGAIVFLALVIGATAFYFATQNKDVATNLAPSPTAAQMQISPTPTPAATDEVKEGSTAFTHEKSKDLAFSGYTVTIPAGWTQKEEKTDLTHLLTLSKNGNDITIMQGPMGGSQCVFEGDMPEGPANDYRESTYVDIKTGQITLRRIEPEGNQTTYSFCSNSTNSQDTFGMPTPFGVITYKLAAKNAAVLTEMDNILATIK